jgi:oligopeptide/dipeptide ABC transporter ATP-binding protein
LRGFSDHLRSPVALGAVALLIVILALAVFAPFFLTGHANHIDVLAIQQGPSWAHPFGTDALGHDVFARTLVAARLSISLALLATLIGTGIGVVLGTLPLVVGRTLGRLIVASFNLVVAFPGLLLALFLALIFGVGARGAVMALAVGIAPSFARLTHTTASGIARADYVSAGKLLGVPRAKILLRHVLPNIAEPLVVNATSLVGGVLLGLSALSYLGFGVQPPAYDWGRMLSDGLPNIYTNPVPALAPCCAIVLAGIAFVLIGEVLTQIVAGQSARHPRQALPATVPSAGSTALTEDDARSMPVLRVENLRVSFPGDGGKLVPVDGVSFTMHAGEIVGVVGESGSGKSLTALAVSLLIRHPGVVTADVHEIAGKDVNTLPRSEREHFLGTSLAMVFQDPMSALNPALRVGRQLSEVSEVHQGLGRREATKRAISRLAAVKIPQPERRARQYPMEYSGGMRQRAVIGMGLMAEPVLIIADEPTTALDVTVQKEILTLLRQVRDDRGAAVLFISHDIAVISDIASRVLVMYAGRIVEDLPVTALRSAAHPYTRALVESVPDMTTDRRHPLATISGRPPDPGSIPPGCPFAPRCAFADAACFAAVPPLIATEVSRRIACWHPLDDDVTSRSGEEAVGRGASR